MSPLDPLGATPQYFGDQGAADATVSDGRQDGLVGHGGVRRWVSNLVASCNHDKLPRLVA